jgi:hypothetical protein
MNIDITSEADALLSRAYPQYAVLPYGDRMALIDHAYDVYRSHEHLGQGGPAEVLSVISFIVMLVGALVGGGIAIAQVVIQARKTRQIASVQAATGAVVERAETDEAKAAAIAADTAKRENTMKVALAGVLGVAGIAAIVTFFT